MDRSSVDVTAADLPIASRARLLSWVELATEPLVVLCVMHLTVLAWRLPLFDRMPAWVFATHAKPISPMACVWLALIPIVAIGSSYRLRRRAGHSVACLVVGGFVFQHALAWSEGRGLDGMRERIVRSGHAEFAEVAVQQRSLWSVLVRYEVKVQGGELGRYAHSKPPGTLLAYMATERVARPFAADPSPAARLAALRTTAAIVWPLVCYLPLWPLYAVVRRLGGADTAWLACALYVLVPSVSLMTLHTDQFLFPLLGVVSVWAAMESARRGSLGLAVLAGAALWLGGFFTFPLLLVAPIALASMWAVASAPGFESRATHPSGSVVLRAFGAGVAGFGLAFVVFRVGLGYDVFARYADARQFNAVWKGWEGGAFQTLYFAWLNLLEFTLWIGVPLAALGSGRIRRAVRLAASGEIRGLTLPALATMLVFGFLVFLGQSKAETARLWLFTVPFCCALAADELRRRWTLAAPWAVALILVLQWLTVVLTKTGQDFF